MRFLPDEELVPAAMVINGEAESGASIHSSPRKPRPLDHVGPKLRDDHSF